MADTLQMGKTRWCHYQTAYHFVWIPKYRQHGFTLLALETDEGYVHCFVSAPPRWAQAATVGYITECQGK